MLGVPALLSVLVLTLIEIAADQARRSGEFRRAFFLP
jgi:hypothetical protein